MIISSTLFYNGGRCYFMPTTHCHMEHEDRWHNFRYIPVMKIAHNLHHQNQSDNNPDY